MDITNVNNNIILSIYHLSEYEIKETQLERMSLVCLGVFPLIPQSLLLQQEKAQGMNGNEKNDERNCQQLYHNYVQTHAIKVEVGFFLP